MLTRLRLLLLQLRLALDSLLHLKRERNRRRYRELLKIPMDKMTIEECREFMILYEYFDGNLDII